MESIIIPEGLTSISDGTFSGCSGLISVTIPNSVATIQHYAFNQCTSLNRVIVSDSITEIATPDNATGIETGAF